jgi:hypothetical protein
MVDIKTAQPGSHANRPRRSISQIVVLHIPHSSRRVPAEERQAILIENTELNGEHGLRMRRRVGMSISGARESLKNLTSITCWKLLVW